MAKLSKPSSENDLEEPKNQEEEEEVNEEEDQEELETVARTTCSDDDDEVAGKAVEPNSESTEDEAKSEGDDDEEDYNCSVEFIRTPFLVQEWEISTKTGKRKETLRLDLIERNSYAKYKDADIIIFNTGHWWTHEKTFNGH